jgi:hypothetical protein
MRFNSEFRRASGSSALPSLGSEDDVAVPPANAEYTAAQFGPNVQLERDPGGRPRLVPGAPAHFETVFAPSSRAMMPW